MHNIKNTHDTQDTLKLLIYMGPLFLFFFAPKAKSVFYYLSDKAQSIVRL